MAGGLITVCHTITPVELLAGVVTWEVVVRALHDSVDKQPAG